MRHIPGNMEIPVGSYKYILNSKMIKGLNDSSKSSAIDIVYICNSIELLWSLRWLHTAQPHYTYYASSNDNDSFTEDFRKFCGP